MPSLPLSQRPSSHGGLKLTQPAVRWPCGLMQLPPKAGCVPPLPQSILGIGFRAQVLPIGAVPLSRKTPGIDRRVPLFHSSCCLVRTNSRGTFWKHFSVRGSLAGHRRYW